MKYTHVLYCNRFLHIGAASWSWRSNVETCRRNYCVAIYIYTGCPSRKCQYSVRSQYRSFYATNSTCTRVLLQTVPQIQLFHCTAVWVWRPICPSVPLYCATVRGVWVGVKRQLAVVSGYTRRTAPSRNGCYRQHTGTSRCTQTSNTPCPHKSCKVHWCWRWDLRICIVQGKLNQLCCLQNKYQY